MINEKHPILNIKLNKELSILRQLYKEFIEGLYELFCLMLDDPIENFWYECFNIIISYLQLLTLSFDTVVSWF